jgi:hypothetical protein
LQLPSTPNNSHP